MRNCKILYFVSEQSAKILLNQGRKSCIGRPLRYIGYIQRQFERGPSNVCKVQYSRQTANIACLYKFAFVHLHKLAYIYTLLGVFPQREFSTNASECFNFSSINSYIHLYIHYYSLLLFESQTHFSKSVDSQILRK